MEQVVKFNQKAVIIVLDSCKDLGDAVAAKLLRSIRQIPVKFYHFGNHEINTFPTESVGGKNVYIIGSGSNVGGTINDNLVTMLAMIRSCRDAGAKYITMVCPLIPYTRSDKKDQPRSPIMAKLVCDMFKTAGVNRLITIDLHASQIQGFFSGPCDNLYAIGPLCEAVKKDLDLGNVVLISPDVGGVKRIENWSKKLGVQNTFLTKSRNHSAVSQISHHELVHQLDLVGKTCLLVDDICDSMGTLCSAANILKAKGASKVIAVVTHGVFSGKAFENLAGDAIDAVYVTNSLPQAENVGRCDKIKVVDVSDLFSKVIMCCVEGKSISALFE